MSREVEYQKRLHIRRRKSRYVLQIKYTFTDPKNALKKPSKMQYASKKTAFSWHFKKGILFLELEETFRILCKICKKTLENGGNFEKVLKNS